jgi:hypothetical protein
MTAVLGMFAFFGLLGFGGLAFVVAVLYVAPILFVPLGVIAAVVGLFYFTSGSRAGKRRD